MLVGCCFLKIGRPKWLLFVGLGRVNNSPGVCIKPRGLICILFLSSNFICFSTLHFVPLPSAVCCCLVAKWYATLLWPHGLYNPPASSVHGIFQGKNPGVTCHFLHQGIFSTQGPNPFLLQWQVDSLPLSHQGSPLLPYISLILQRVMLLNLWCQSQMMLNHIYQINSNSINLKIKKIEWSRKTWQGEDGFWAQT